MQQPAQITKIVVFGEFFCPARQRAPASTGIVKANPLGALGGPEGAPIFSHYFPSMLLRCGEHLRCNLHWYVVDLMAEALLYHQMDRCPTIWDIETGVLRRISVRRSPEGWRPLNLISFDSFGMGPQICKMSTAC